MNSPYASPPFGGTTVDPTVKPKTLAEQIQDDVRDVFCASGPSHFGVLASIEPAGQTAFYVSGVFDKSPAAESIYTQVEAWSVTFTTQEAAVRQVKNGDKVVISGKAWVVSSTDSDETGITTITLAEAIDG